MSPEQKSPQEVVAWLEREIAPQRLPGRVKIQLTDMLRERDAEHVKAIEAAKNQALHEVVCVIEEAAHRAPIDGPFVAYEPWRESELTDEVRPIAIPWDHKSIRALIEVLEDAAQKRFGRAEDMRAWAVREFVEPLQDEIKRLRAAPQAVPSEVIEALKFYAVPGVYECENFSMPYLVSGNEYDQGERARECLKKLGVG